MAPRIRLYQRLTAPVFVPVAAAAVSIAWFSPLSEPVRAQRTAQPPALTQAVFTPALSTGWSTPLSEPTRRQVRVQPSALSYSYFTEVVAAEVQFSVSQTTVPYERTLLYQSIAAPVPFVVAGETITVDKWLAPLSQPTLRRSDIAGRPTFFFVGSDTARDHEWLAPLSEPTRRKPTVQPDALAFYELPVTVADFRWPQPLSEPTRRKPTVHPDALTLHPNPTTVAAYQWLVSLSEPTRRQVRVQPDALTWAYFTPAATEIVTVDKWFAPFTEQSRIKTGLPAHEQLAFAFHPSPVTVAAFRWLVPLSEPTRRKVDNQPAALVWSGFTPALATGWIGPLSQPTYRIRFAEHPAFWWSAFTPAVTGTATSLQTDWYNQLQQPSRDLWSPNGMQFTWLPPSGEAGPTPPTNVQKDGDPDYWNLPWFEVEGGTFHERLRHKAVTALEEAVDAAKAAEPAKAKRAARKAAKSVREYAKAAGALLSDDVVVELGETAKQLNFAASQWNRDELLERVSTARMALLALQAFAAMQQQDEEDALIALMVAQI